MNQNKRGQSIIEYSIIAILVILGVVVMGPYVLRSVNAHFKLWDDQVQDSFNDRLKQAPSDQVSIPGNCRVEQKIRGSCGPVQGKTVTCKENERYIYTTFNPPGCYIAESCEADPQCCMPAVRGNCGTRPRDAGAQSRRTTGLTVNGKTIYEAVNTLGNSNGCYYGEREIRQRCGAAPETIIGCVVDTFGREFDPRDDRLPPGQQPVTGPDNGLSTDDDDPSCAALCTGLVPTHSTLCPDTTIDVPQDTLTLASGTGLASCNAAQKCKFYCDAPFTRSSNHLICQIQQSFIIAPQINDATNNQSFQMCANLGQQITSATMTGAGCFSGNPSGSTPSNACTAIIK